MLSVNSGHLAQEYHKTWTVSSDVVEAYKRILFFSFGLGNKVPKRAISDR